MSVNIVLVGHCNIDGPRLQSEIESSLPDVEVSRVNTQRDLECACKEGSGLLLVNREPVGFDREAGVDLIRKMRELNADQKAMLVSDIPEAQAEAVAAGALPGFGKRDLGSPKLVETIKRALA